MLFLAFSYKNVQATVDTCTGKFDKSGKKHGIWSCCKEGYVSAREKYRHGKLLSIIRFNEKGVIIETVDKKGRVRKNKSCGC